MNNTPRGNFERKNIAWTESITVCSNLRFLCQILKGIPLPPVEKYTQNALLLAIFRWNCCNYFVNRYMAEFFFKSIYFLKTHAHDFFQNFPVGAPNLISLSVLQKIQKQAFESQDFFFVLNLSEFQWKWWDSLKIERNSITKWTKNIVHFCPFKNILYFVY